MRKLSLIFGVFIGALSIAVSAAAQSIPNEPIEIGTAPQFFFDDYLVDNRFAVPGNKAEIPLVRLHTPQKHPRNPVLVDPGVAPSHVTVRYDAEAKLFRAWYQAAVPLVTGEKTSKGRLMGYYHVRYAESPDGIEWTRPKLGLYEYQGNKDNNICFAHPRFEEEIRAGTMSATRGTSGISSKTFLNEADLPAEDRRGYKYLMTYMLRGKGKLPEEQTQLYLIGTKDGIHWDREHQMSLFVGGSDGWQGMTYDARQKKYVAYMRPRDRYEAGGSPPPDDLDFNGVERAYEGVVRRIGYLESDALWQPWQFAPQTILLPDAQDQAEQVTAHMSIGVHAYHGHFFGLLIPYVPKETLWAELVLSRNGKDFQRTHHRVNSTGPAGSWDAKQAWMYPQWVEVGDEWRYYYFGADSAPNTPLQTDTTWGIGLASIRKEGLASLGTTSKAGGVVVTRLLKWPGGELRVNAVAPEPGLRVRVTTKHRQTVPGFDYSDCVPLVGDATAHAVRWQGHKLDSLRGQELRLEFLLPREADLYTFRATGEE
jgi:hypothetical protein